jgi:hypothetical protein
MDSVINFKDIQKEKELEQLLENLGEEICDLEDDGSIRDICKLIRAMMLLLHEEQKEELHIYYKDDEFIIKDTKGQIITAPDCEVGLGLTFFDENGEVEQDAEDELIGDIIELCPEKVVVHCKKKISDLGIEILQLIIGEGNIILKNR